MLSERLSELEKDVVVREEEVGQLTLQLELKNRESRATEEQLHAHITHLQARLWLSIMTVVCRIVIASMFTTLDKWFIAR